jgi:hypothetical protein
MPEKTGNAKLVARNDPRLIRAYERGRVVRRQMAKDEGGAIACSKAAQLLSISEAGILRHWREHRLVGWKRGSDVFFPVWQCKCAKVLPGIEEVLAVFASDDHWRVMGYFLMTRASLQDKRPLDLLRSGQVAEIVAHAKAYAAENLW